MPHHNRLHLWLYSLQSPRQFLDLERIVTEYYRTIFTIREMESQTSAHEGTALMLKIEKIVRAWAGEEFGEILDKPNGEWRTDKGTVKLMGRLSEPSGLFWLIWERFDASTAEPVWRLGFRLATEGNEVEADIEVRSTGGNYGQISPDALPAEPPFVVEALLEEFDCRIGSHQLAGKSQSINSDTAVSYARDVILHAERSLPLILVSEDSAGSRVLNADRLQIHLLGIAMVATCDDDAGWILNKELRPLLCYNGTVRVYAPGFLTNDSPLRHPYWLMDNSRALGELRLTQVLRDECMNRSPHRTGRIDYKIFPKVRQLIRREIFEDLRSQARQSEEESEEKKAELDTFVAEFERDEKRINELDDQLAESEKEKEHLRRQVEQLKIALANRNGSPEFETASDDVLLELGSVAQVMERGRTHLSRVRFLSSVIKDAENVHFQRPREIYRVLEAINECGEKRSEGSLGISVEAWLKERGISYVPRESETTMGMYGNMRKFVDDYTGKAVLMEPHIKLNGNSFRIHLDWDDDNSEWLIGYMGPHLPTASG